MKLLYKIILFLGMFELMVIIVNGMGVFTNTFYSDIETDALKDKGIWEVVQDIMLPTDNKYIGEVSVYALAGLFVAGGILSGIATKNVIIPSLIFLLYVVFAMCLSSYEFFQDLFTKWNSDSLVYLGVVLGVGMVIVAIITVIETPTHGRSGT